MPAVFHEYGIFFRTIVRYERTLVLQPFIIRYFSDYGLHHLYRLQFDVGSLAAPEFPENNPKGIHVGLLGVEARTQSLWG